MPISKPTTGSTGWDGAVNQVIDRVNALDGIETTIAGKQASDPDLAAIAALDSTQAGTIGSTGSGWVFRTWAQVKAALSLTKSDVGLGAVDNTADVDKPISSATSTALAGKASTTHTHTGSTATTHNGLALTEPDGGHRYWSRFRFGMRDDPQFFPVGLWTAGIDSAANVAADAAAGINIYTGPYGSSDLTLLAGTGMYAIINRSDFSQLTPASWANNSAVIGTGLDDERDMVYNGSGGDQSQGIADMTSYLGQVPADGRLIYNNYGKGVAFFGTDYWSRRYVNEFQDIVSVDVYWHSDSSTWTQYQGAKFVNGSTAALTQAQGRLGYNYGLTVQRVRSLVYPARSKPVFGFVELAPQGDANAGTAISVAEISAAAWHMIIAGARGICLFNLQFATDGSGTITDYNVLRDQPTIRTGITNLTTRIRSVAPAINAPSVTGFCTPSSGVAATVRYQGGAYWIIAGSKQTASQTATFSGLPAEYAAATVAVVGESRTITASSGTFSDTFADQNAVHIYKVA